MEKIREFGLERRDSEREAELMFTLKSLKVVELIKEGRAEEAIVTARAELLPLVRENVRRGVCRTRGWDAWSG